jgi:hypothetical protein
VPVKKTALFNFKRGNITRRVEEATAVVPESIRLWNQPFIEAKSASVELMSVSNGPKNPFDPA